MKCLPCSIKTLMTGVLFTMLQLLAVFTYGQVKDGGIYCLQARHSSKALDIKDYSTADNAVVQQWTLHQQTNQQFRFKSAGDGSYFIQNVKSGKYFDIYNGSKSDHAVLQQYTFHGGPNQRFYVKAAPNGYIYIQNKNSGKYIDIYDALNSNGAKVQQFTFNGGANQQFKPIPVSGDSNNTAAKKRVQIKAELTYYRTSDGQGAGCSTLGNTEDEIYFKTHAVIMPKAGAKANIPATWKRAGNPDIWEMGPCTNRNMDVMLFDSKHWIYLAPTGGGTMAPQDQMVLSVAVAEQDNKQLSSMLTFAKAFAKIAADVAGYLLIETIVFSIDDIKDDLLSGTEKLIKSLYDDGDKVLGVVEIGIVPKGNGHQLCAKSVGNASLASCNGTVATFKLSGFGSSYTLKLTLIES